MPLVASKDDDVCRCSLLLPIRHTAVFSIKMTSSLDFQITKPTLLLKKEQCLENIRNMSTKAAAANATLRPHCKTHASLEVARWMREYGSVTGITVSSLSMAAYFAPEWDDITVAFPVNILEMDTIISLAKKLRHLNLLVENIPVIERLEAQIPEDAAKSVGVYVKIDVGYGRTGIPAADIDRIDPILEMLKASNKLKFVGFLTHAGHTYHCRGDAGAKVASIHSEARAMMQSLKKRYLKDFPGLQLSFGDTPSCSILGAEELECWDELRPGNFVFYDLEQAAIGSCLQTDIAVAVACPIVAIHPDRREIVLYGGGVHCSKDRLTGEEEGTIFGRIAKPSSDGGSSGGGWNWDGVMDGMHLRSLSQEHGIVVVSESQNLDSFRIGDLLYVLPVHSCMTADCLKHNGYRIAVDGQHVERMKD